MNIGNEDECRDMDVVGKYRYYFNKQGVAADYHRWMKKNKQKKKKNEF